MKYLNFHLKRKILEIYFIKRMNSILNNQINSDTSTLSRNGVTSFEFPNVFFNNNFLFAFQICIHDRDFNFIPFLTAWCEYFRKVSLFINLNICLLYFLYIRSYSLCHLHNIIEIVDLISWKLVGLVLWL